jgi:hypothetical protein
MDLVVLGRGGGFKVRGSTTLRVLRTNDPLLVIPGGARRTQCTKQQFAASESGLNDKDLRGVMPERQPVLLAIDQCPVKGSVGSAALPC